MRRRLSRDEAQLWARVAQTVVPLHPLQQAKGGPAAAIRNGPDQAPVANAKELRIPARLPDAAAPAPAKVHARPLDRHGLDSSWDKKLARGLIAPDFTLDLHGHSLDAAHARLDHGLAQAKALGARLVLVITGRPRPVDAADRGNRRGAIRAKLLDWLALGAHAGDIAAVRGAHRRHGGAGAVYLVLRRRK